MDIKDNSCILVIPDLHFPYCHVDALNFIASIYRRYKITRTICLGDELDHHALSFHDHDPDLDSSGVELVKAIGYIETLFNLCPDMDLLESNHGSMAYRKAKHHGMPRHLLKSYNEVLNVPVSWKWHDTLIITLPNGQKCKFVHGAGSNILAASQQSGMSIVQGHHHSLFEVRYWNNGLNLMFAVSSGCLIDDVSLAFAYNKLQIKRPLLGVTLIIDSLPFLIPMQLDENGRWNGKS